MDLPVVIMAGGRGTRLGWPEKPLATVGGQPLVERVAAAVREAGIRSPTVATSRWTPATESFARSLGLPTLETPGHGYVKDGAWLAKKIGRFISVASDLPFLPAKDFRLFLEFTAVVTGNVTGVILSGSLPPGMPHGFAWHSGGDGGHDCEVVGVNVVDPADGGDGVEYIFRDPAIGVNINTALDLEWANSYLNATRAVVPD